MRRGAARRLADAAVDPADGSSTRVGTRCWPVRCFVDLGDPRARVVDVLRNLLERRRAWSIHAHVGASRRVRGTGGDDGLLSDDRDRCIHVARGGEILDTTAGAISAFGTSTRVELSSSPRSSRCNAVHPRTRGGWGRASVPRRLDLRHIHAHVKPMRGSFGGHSCPNLTSKRVESFHSERPRSSWCSWGQCSPTSSRSTWSRSYTKVGALGSGSLHLVAPQWDARMVDHAVHLPSTFSHVLGPQNGGGT